MRVCACGYSLRLLGLAVEEVQPSAGPDSKIALPVLPSLSYRVLRAVAEGKSNKIIASQLSITEPTIKAQMKSILPNLGASDRTHAVVIATSRGFPV